MVSTGKEAHRKNLRDLRKNANLTQDELAEILQVHRETVIGWEKGRYRPRLEAWQFHILCQKFNCTLLEFADAAACSYEVKEGQSSEPDGFNLSEAGESTSHKTATH